MPSLPTCWYCPECERRFEFPIDATTPHWKPHRMAADRDEVCNGVPEECIFIPPGTPPEQILNLVGEVSVWDDAFIVRPREAS